MGRLQDSLQDFGARFSDIDAIHQEVLAAESAQAKPRWWKHLLPGFLRGSATDSDRILNFMNTLDENQVIELTSDALGEMLPAHRDFKSQHVSSAAAERFQQNVVRKPSKIHSGSNHDTSASSSNQKYPSHLGASVNSKTAVAESRVHTWLESGSRKNVTGANLAEIVIDPPGLSKVKHEMEIRASDHRRNSAPKHILHAGSSTHAEIVKEVDIASGRNRRANFQAGARSWLPPDALHTPELRTHPAARDRNASAVRPQLSRPGNSSANAAHLEREITELNADSSSSVRHDRSVLMELEEVVVHSAGSSVAQRHMQRSASGLRGHHARPARTTQMEVNVAGAETAHVAEDRTKGVEMQLTRAISSARNAKVNSRPVTELICPPDPPPAVDEEGLKFAKQPEENAAARAALKQNSLSATAEFGGSGNDSQLRRMSKFVVRPSEANDPPPPFDDDDLKLVNRRNEMAAGRAAKKQSSLRTMAGLGLPQNDAQLPRGSSAAAHSHDAHPPFDEEGLKFAKQPEENAAARAALKQNSLSATAAGNLLAIQRKPH
jgi:hypothetical protein